MKDTLYRLECMFNEIQESSKLAVHLNSLLAVKQLVFKAIGKKLNYKQKGFKYNLQVFHDSKHCIMTYLCGRAYKCEEPETYPPASNTRRYPQSVLRCR